MGFITGETIVPQHTSPSATPATADRAAFADSMVEMSTGINLLIERLNHAYDIVSDLGHSPGQDGWYAMNAITETQWIAQRLSEGIRPVGIEFNGIRSEAAEASR
jgi:hypothetical protein